MPPQHRPDRLHRRLRRHLRAYFLAGVLVMAPISVTLYLAWLFIDSIDEWVAALVPRPYSPETYLPFSLPGIGVLIVLASLTLIGMLTASYLGRLAVRLGEAVLVRIPVLRSVYGAIKHVLKSAFASQSQAFRQVVLLEYPCRGAWAIGLVTGAPDGEVQDVAEDEFVSVFLPKGITAYKGFTLLLPQRDLIPLSIPVEDAFKFLASGGVAPPPEWQAETDRPAKGAVG